MHYHVKIVMLFRVEFFFFFNYLLLVYSLCGRSSFSVLSSVIFIMAFFSIVLGYKES